MKNEFMQRENFVNYVKAFNSRLDISDKGLNIIHSYISKWYDDFAMDKYVIPLNFFEISIDELYYGAIKNGYKGTDKEAVVLKYLYNVGRYDILSFHDNKVLYGVKNIAYENKRSIEDVALLNLLSV